MSDDSRPTKAQLAHYETIRKERILHDGQVRQVACPLCEATPGQDCHTNGWYVSSKFHVARERAAGLR